MHLRNHIEILEEDILDYEARYKSYEIYESTKTLEWVSQELYYEASRELAANQISKYLEENGFKDWTVKVTVRDMHNGRNTIWTLNK